MRPLTMKRLLWTCGALAAVLLACVVIALKLGAVPISVIDLVLNLGRVAILHYVEQRNDGRSRKVHILLNAARLV